MNNSTYTKYRIIQYCDHENYQHGHGVLRNEFRSFDDAYEFAMNAHLFPEEILSITFQNHPEFEVFSGEYHFTSKDKGPFTIDDFWIYPDPNYRGTENNSFWGKISEYKAMTHNRERE